MTWIYRFLSLFFLRSEQAFCENMSFKQNLSPEISGKYYLIATILLLLLLFFLAQKHKHRLHKKSQFQLIEKKHLSHKTVLYLIDYHEQRFVIADNQQALAIYPIPLVHHNLGVTNKT